MVVLLVCLFIMNGNLTGGLASQMTSFDIKSTATATKIKIKNNNNLTPKPRLLTQTQLQNLKHYRYSAIDRSFLSRYILNYFWNWLVSLVPMSIAPNLITLTGLLFMISATGISFLYPTSSAAPPVVFLYVAFCLSTYLNLDAIDGKQARRTRTSGPLGELFDHGCDAINMVLTAALIPFIFNLPLCSFLTVSMTLSGYAAFFAVTWEEFHTGTLCLDYISGPVEGAWALVISSLISFFYGPNFWDRSVFFSGMSMSIKHCACIIFIIGACITISSSVARYLNIKNKNNNIRSLIREFMAPSVYFIICLLASVPVINSNHSNSLRWFIFFSGVPACFRISSTILAHITKTKSLKFSFYSLEYFPMILLLLQNILISTSFQDQFKYKICLYFIKFSTIISSLVYLRTLVLIIIDICSFLNINCLTIKNNKNNE